MASADAGGKNVESLWKECFILSLAKIDAFICDSTSWAKEMIGISMDLCFISKKEKNKN